MKWLGENPFHSVLLLTEKPGDWAFWQIVPIPIVLAATAGVLCARVTGASPWGWTMALGLLVFAAIDWALLAILPKRGVSFGPVQPPFLALGLFRWLMALLAALFAAQWAMPALLLWTLLQVGLVALAVYGLLVEPFRLQITRLQIASEKLSNPGRPVLVVH